MSKPFRLAGCLALALAIAPAAARADTVTVNADTSGAQPKAAFQDVVKQFEAANPDTQVVLNVYDHESYKQSLPNWLTSAPPDVVLWYTGTRMRQFVQPGLLADVSALWTAPMKQAFGSTAVDLVTDGGRQYAVPYTQYQYGLYYRGDILKKAGVGPIATWDDLVGACDKLNAIGVAPIDIGSKDLWPTAAWFDYLDLRINGYAAHMQLMSGKVSYLDPRVRDVFAHWKQLLDHKCFVANHAELSMQESQAVLFQGRAAMMLIGNFITENFSPEMQEVMQFEPFPAITPGVADAEDSPMDSVSIPQGARNKAGAMKFLAFMMRPDIQTLINRYEKQIPANSQAQVIDDRFLVEGRKLLEATPDHSQFFDRDTNEALATLAMKGFQEFMVRPARLDRILADIERARLRIYAPG
jgi:multiple sugar transport system substrate-binding protein